MDAYDPKAVAQRELDELTEAVRGPSYFFFLLALVSLFDGAVLPLGDAVWEGGGCR
jgi:hypothetical protein